MLSVTAEYALRAMVVLAKADGAPLTSEAIASVSQVPHSYLAKILQGLTRSGLLTSKRGKRGGFVLGREPLSMTLLEVIDAVDPIRDHAECPRVGADRCPELCPLHRLLHEESTRTRQAMASTTLGELVGANAASFP